MNNLNHNPNTSHNSNLNNIEAIRENSLEDFLSDDGSMEIREEERKKVMQYVQDVWKDGDTSMKDETVFINPEFEEILLDELEDEHELEWKQAPVIDQMTIDLVPMNELQKARIHTDNYPWLPVRKYLLIKQKQVSLLASWVVRHSAFELSTLIVIVFNSIMLALDDPTTNQQSAFQDTMDIVFLSLYTSEAFLKIIAMGFAFNHGAYLRDIWNILDFTVIVTAFIPYFVDNSGLQLSALRSLRVLRPLRTISSVQSLRNIMNALFASFGQLSNALIVLAFFYTIFAIAGLQLFQGYTKNRCFDELYGIIQMSGFDASEPFCSDYCDEGYICGKMFSNPENDLISFDNFGMGMMQVFTTTTLEGWTTIMEAVILTFSQLATIYFILLVVVGAFFLVNLTLAIIKLNYSKAQSQKTTVEVTEICYNFRRLRRLNLYQAREPSTSPTAARKQTMMRQPTKLMHQSHHMRIQPTISVTPAVKVQFQPMQIKGFSKPTQLKNSIIQLHGIQGVSNNNKQTTITAGDMRNSINLQQQQYRRTSVFRNTNRIDESPLDELDVMLQQHQQRKGTFIRQESRLSPGAQSPNKDISRISADSRIHSNSPQQPRNDKFTFLLEQIQHREIIEEDKLSVTLSELSNDHDSIPDEIIAARLEEMEISFQQSKISDPFKLKEDRKPNVLPKQKRRKAEINKVEEITKDDEVLKIRLYQSKLIPRVLYQEHKSDSINDVLVSQQIRLEVREKQKQDQLIAAMKFKLDYRFKNSMEKLSYSKSRKTMKSKYVTTNNNLRQVMPFQESMLVETPIVEFRKRKDKRKMTIKQLSYSEYCAGFNSVINSENTKLMQVITEVQQIKLPGDELLCDSIFYQEYHQQRKSDIQQDHGLIESESSIEDIILISDYQLCNEDFIKQMNKIMMALNYNENDYYIYLDGIVGILKNIQRKMFIFVDSRLFQTTMNTSVAINTIVLALDGLVQDTQTLDDFNNAFTIIFTIELGLKLIGMGVMDYLRDYMNVFDALIVAISLVDLIFLSGSGTSISAFKAIRIFRAFRVLRVTKLMRSLTFMNFLVTVLSNAFSSLMYIFLLLVLFIYIFTLLGMSFFGGQLTNTPSRQSYDDFLSSFLVVFQVLTLENWNSLLYELLLQPVSSIITVLYLIIWIFIGNYVLLNLFLASLLDYFEEEYTIKHEQLREDILDSTMQPQDINSTSNAPLENTNTGGYKQNTKFIYFQEFGLCQESLYIFSQNNPIRKMCYRLAKFPLFDQLVLVVIVLSSLKLVIDTYIDNYIPESNYFFAYFFGIESVIKIIAFGLCLEPHSYLRESWNVLDMFIVICSYIDLYVSTIDLSFVKILRLLRTLRPLRFISHNRSMKLLVNTLINSASGIANVGVVVILAWMMFAILGVSLQKGKMHYCDMGDGQTYYYHSDECSEHSGVWKNRDMNFDNVFNAMLSLFIISTLEGWPTEMYWFIDADESGPIKDSQLWFCSYFIIFILFGSILLMNLFVGVILVNYKVAEDEMKDKSVSKAQEDWINTLKLIADSNPNFSIYYPPLNKYRAFAFNIVSSNKFDTLIMSFIIMNIVTMALSYEGASTTYNTALDNLNLVFSIVFIIEAILKMTAFGFIGYFRNGWNQFDCFVVCTSILDLVLDFTGNKMISFLKSGPQLARVFRVLRITRLFRLVKSLGELKRLIDTAIFSLPALLNVSALMFLIFFIFSILGVFLFSSVKSGYVINSDNNFSNFHSSMLLLFRSATGEDWHLVMYDIMNGVSPYYCFFFILFVIIQQFIMLNLFVLIILDQYDQFYFNSDNPLQRFQEYEADFVEVWAPLAVASHGQFIHDRQLVELMLHIKKPLGYDIESVEREEVKKWKQLNEDADHSQHNINRIKAMVYADAKRHVSTQIMTMLLSADENRQLEYHYVFFAFMKNCCQDKAFLDNTSIEGTTKLKLKEEETIAKIRKSKQYFNEINPLVSLFFVMMSFKAYKRYAIKRMERSRRKQKEYSEKSSESSYLCKNSELQLRESSNASIDSFSSSNQKFLPAPDLAIYQSDVHISMKHPSEYTQSSRDRMSSQIQPKITPLFLQLNQGDSSQQESKDKMAEIDSAYGFNKFGDNSR